MSFRKLVRQMALIVMTGIAAAAFAQSPDQLQKMEQAISTLKAEKPAKARKILVFSQTLGFRHASIPHGHAALRMLGEKTGAFNSDHTEDITQLEPKNIQPYDAIVFLNTTGELVTTASMQKGLLKFISEGKGFVGIHAATDCCYEWHEYGEMLGGYFNGHPWNADRKVVLKLDDPDHPINKPFGGKPFEVTDEIYQFKEPYSRNRVRVLTSLDTEKTDMDVPGKTRADNDYGVSWVRSFGKGRVFNCSLGHNEHIYWDSVVLGHYLAGIQFALGDLEAPTDPIPFEPKAYLDRVLRGTAELSSSYQYGSDNSYFLTLDAALRDAGKVDRAEASRVLTDAVLTSTTIAGRMELLRRLTQVAQPGDAVRLAPLLDHESDELAKLVLMVLQETQGEEVDRLLATEAETSRPVQVGVVQALATREFAAAVPELERLARHDDIAIAAAATNGLGQIQDKTAREALWEFFNGITELDRREMALRALILWADGNQSSDEAMKTYDSIMDEAVASSPARLAALQGMIKRTDDAQELVKKYFEDENPATREIVDGYLVRSKDEKTSDYVLQQLESSEGDQHLRWLAIGTARADRRVLRHAMALLEEDNSSEEQSAALDALAVLGDTTAIPRLLSLATGGALAEKSRAILDRINASGTDRILTEIAANIEVPENERVQALRVLARRKPADQLPAVLELAATDDTIQAEVFKTAAALATAESFTTFSVLHENQSDSAIRRESEKAVIAALRASKNPKFYIKDLEARLGDEETLTDADATWVNILATIDDPSVPKILLEKYRGNSKEVRLAVIRGLSEHPQVEALDPLLELMRGLESELERSLAVRGAARLITLPSDRSSSETVAAVDQVLEAAKSVDDLRAVVGHLGEIAEPAILEKLKGYFTREEVKAEAQLAALELIGKIHPFIGQEATTVIDAIAADSDDVLKPRIAEAREKVKTGGTAIVAWRVVGPLEGGDDINALADATYPPDEQEELTGGRLVVAQGIAGAAYGVDLEKIFGGEKENSVAYAECFVNSESAQEMTLLAGSDDGIIISLNGEVVHDAREVRPFKPDSDKVNVKLREGKNVLRLKVLQLAGEWSYAVELKSPDGGSPSGLTFSVGGW